MGSCSGPNCSWVSESSRICSLPEALANGPFLLDAFTIVGLFFPLQSDNTLDAHLTSGSFGLRLGVAIIRAPVTQMQEILSNVACSLSQVGIPLFL